MNLRRHACLRALLLLLAVTLATAVVPQFARSHPASAQTSTSTAGAADAGTATAPPATGTASPVIQVTSGPAVNLGLTTTSLVTLCGTLTAFTAAGTGTAGSITIAGFTMAIAPGVSVTGATATVGTYFCLQATFSSSGQIVTAVLSPSSTSPAPSINVCGTVSAFSPAGSSTPGSITIGGGTFAIAPGVSPTGASLTTGDAFCLQSSVNTSIQLTTVTVSTPLAATAYHSLGSAGGYRVGRTYND